MAKITQITPTQNSKAEITICALSRLLVCWVVVSGVPIATRSAAADAIGAPQFGQAAAMLETVLLHSGH